MIKRNQLKKGKPVRVKQKNRVVLPRRHRCNGHHQQHHTCAIAFYLCVSLFLFVSLKLLLTDKRTQTSQRMEDCDGEIKWEG